MPTLIFSGSIRRSETKAHTVGSISAAWRDFWVQEDSFPRLAKVAPKAGSSIYCFSLRTRRAGQWTCRTIESETLPISALLVPSKRRNYQITRRACIYSRKCSRCLSLPLASILGTS